MRLGGILLISKWDGLALAVIYEAGVFVQAVSRGDGFVGEDVTTNAKTIRNLPLKLQPPAALAKQLTGRLEIRGEVVIYKEDFRLINEAAEAAGLPAYANARNLAAGTMRQLDPQLVATRRLAFKAYDILGSGFKTHQEVYKALAALDFSHNTQAGHCEDLAGLQTKIKHLTSTRHNLPFGNGRFGD